MPPLSLPPLNPRPVRVRWYDVLVKYIHISSFCRRSPMTKEKMRSRMEIDGAVFTRVRPLMGCRRLSACHRLMPYIAQYPTSPDRVCPFQSSGATCLSIRLSV